MVGEESNIDRLLKTQPTISPEPRSHKTPVTILFTDVVGSTAYFDRYGDTAGVVMLERHTELATGAVAEFQGNLIKTIGDSVMADFPDPVHGVRAAVEIQRRLLRLNQTLPERDRVQLRIGINAGHGIRRGNDVFGDAVNVAARITKKTGPAQILISRSVRDAILPESDLRCTWLGKFAFAGKAEKEDLFEVVWTETAAYTELRAHMTAALARGDLVSPGLRVDDLAQPTRSPTPVPGDEPTLELSTTPVQVALGARYDLLGEVGSGGMGIVYKARDRETGELVALKILRPEIAADQRAMERFKNELRLSRKITHKNVCRVYEFNRTGGVAYISMEFVEGESLRAVLKRFGTLPVRKGIQIARQICAALREAHAQQVVHRDLKPENVMVDQNGNVKVMDFGIARSVEAGTTSTGAFIGTPAYMAPEQAEGKPVDRRADIYSFGLVLYEMFTGVPAFSGDTPLSVALKHIRETPPPPSQHDPTVPAPVERVILRCLEKDPAKRFQSVDELEAALVRQAAPTPLPPVPVPARAPDLLGAAAEPRRSRAWLAVVGLALAGVLMFYFLSGREWFAPVEQESQPAAETTAQEAPAVEQTPPSSASGQVSPLTPVLPPASEPPAPTVPLPAIHFDSALRAFNSGNYDFARQQFDTFLRLYPHSKLVDEAHYLRAVSFQLQRRFPEAIAGYDKLLRDFPDSDKVPATRLRKGEALLLSGDRAAGLRELRALIHYYPDSEAAQQAQQRLQRLERFGQADSTLGLQVRELNPQMARRLGLSQQEGGLLVRQVEPGSFAQKLGLRRGDIIMVVNGRSVRSQRALMDMQRSLTPGREVVVRIKRRQRGRGVRDLTLRATP